MDGIIPMCLVGIAGSTNTGAVDNLKALRQIANDEGMWLHVDAAYGGGVLLSDNWSDLIIGAELADSVTIDPHKWFFAPVDAGAILVKDKKQLLHSYGMKPPYLKDEKDTKDERYDYYAYSFEQSRRFRGLKVWMSFKRYGKKQLGKWVDQNIEQAKYLYKLCQQNPEFVPANYPKMSAICIRFDPGNLKEDDLRELHIDVARKIEENGNFWITTTQLKEKSWFRINPVNFRTRLEHMEGLMGELKRECTKYMNSFI